jgi:ABC-type uncharacterized transport system involved in gliding motility auxiliary subunit
MNFFNSFSPLIKMQARRGLFLLAFISAASISYHYSTEIDLTANRSNTLSKTTQTLLAQLPEAIHVKVYLKTAHPLRRQIKQLLERYHQQKSNLTVQFIDPEIELQKVRDLTIGSQGLTIVEYQGRSESIAFLDEASLTQALLQFAENKARWVSFLTGHGERSPTGIANFDLGLFNKHLAQRNIKTQRLNWVQTGALPDNSAVLVLATPRVALLPGELQRIQQYVSQGGNLLLLTDPDAPYLQPIEQQLGLTKLPGTLLDNSGQLYGLNDPHFVLVSQYNAHKITQGFENITVYPTAAALAVTQKTDFQTVAIFSHHAESQGALPLAYALTRNLPNKPQQRIVVVGDGDFLSNTFVGNVGNREMGLRIFNWLTHDDRFVDIPIKIAPGRSLQLSPLALGTLSSFFLVGLPLLLIGSGLMMGYKRQRR